MQLRRIPLVHRLPYADFRSCPTSLERHVNAAGTHIDAPDSQQPRGVKATCLRRHQLATQAAYRSPDHQSRRREARMASSIQQSEASASAAAESTAPPQKATVLDAVRTIDPLADLQRLPNMPCARYSLLFGIVAGVSVGAMRFIFSRAGRRGGKSLGRGGGRCELGRRRMGSWQSWSVVSPAFWSASDFWLSSARVD